MSHTCRFPTALMHLQLLLLLAIVATKNVAGFAAPAPGSAPSIIVGGGRIGGLLKDLGTDEDVVVKRGEGIPATPSEGPIYVCTRNDDLASVVEATPEARRKDLVFLQNGMLGDFIKGQGLSPTEVTQALLYLAVPSLGAAPIDGKTSVNPEGLTKASGPWAEELAAKLAKGDLSCAIPASEDEFLKAALEKHIFICVTNLVGQVKGRSLTFGQVYEEELNAERQALVKEIAAAGGEYVGVQLDNIDETDARLVAYGRSVADFPTGVKEFPWRNGWFHDISKAAVEAGKPDPMPLHTAALEDLGLL